VSDTIPSLPNLYGNPLAAMDIETTGTEGGYHEVCSLAIVPLDQNLQPCHIDGVRPFFIEKIQLIYPERCDPKAMRVHKLKIDDLMTNGVPQHKVIDFLMDWYNDLPLPHLKRLTPLVHGWGTEKSFITPWLGPELFGALFHPHPRDTLEYCLMLNDRSAMMGYSVPFRSLSLTNICKKLDVINHDAHNALADAIATAAVYKELMTTIL
jgi:DNA polymerase III epsilon subunit-like protein